MDYTIKTYLERENSRTLLRVNKPKLSNAGSFTVRVTNGNLTKMENFTLIVRSAPTVEVSVLNTQGLYNKGMEYKLKCRAEGFPIPEIKWIFKPCNSFTECDNGKTVSLGELVQKRHRNMNTYSRVSFIQEVARRSGQFICQACNTINCIYDKVDFFVTDVPNEGFAVDGPENALVGEAITLKCSASKYNFSSDSIEWFKDTLQGERLLETGPRFRVDSRSTAFSITKSLTLMNVTIGDKGRYLCKARRQNYQEEQRLQNSYQTNRRHSNHYFNSNYQNEDSGFEELSFKLDVLPLERPVFIDTNMETSYDKNTQPLIVQEAEDGVELFCKIHGRPRPQITWYFNGNKLRPTLINSRVQIADDNQVVRISYVSPKDEGLYECKATNKMDSLQGYQMVQLKSTVENGILYEQISIPIIVAVVIAILLVIVIIVIVKICYMKSKARKSASVSSSASGCPWKDPPTPPTPKLTQFEMPITANNSSYNDEEDCHITLTENASHHSAFDSLRRNTPHPHTQCCNSIAPIYGHCLYQAHHGLPIPPVSAASPLPPSAQEPLLPCHSVCECSLQTLPQGTLDRQFPHLYASRLGTPTPPPGNGIPGTLMMHHHMHHGTLQRHYESTRARSHSISPSRRSAEY